MKSRSDLKNAEVGLRPCCRSLEAKATLQNSIRAGSWSSSLIRYPVNCASVSADYAGHFSSEYRALRTIFFVRCSDPFLSLTSIRLNISVSVTVSGKLADAAYQLR